MNIKSVSITYDSRKRAKLFAGAFALATLKGHDMSKDAKNGSVTVTVYDLTEKQLETLKDLVAKY